MIGKDRIKVEVKSSIPPNQETRSKIINLRDIKITASHDKGRTWIMPEKLESEIHVQIYFYARSYRRGFDDFEELAKSLDSDYHIIEEVINASKYNHPLFSGWKTKELIIEHLNSLPAHQKTWTFSWTDRIYWKCPISMAFTLPQLLEYMDKLK